jgi:hypothetical protein
MIRLPFCVFPVRLFAVMGWSDVSDVSCGGSDVEGPDAQISAMIPDESAPRRADLPGYSTSISPPIASITPAAPESQMVDPSPRRGLSRGRSASVDPAEEKRKKLRVQLSLHPDDSQAPRSAKDPGTQWWSQVLKTSLEHVRVQGSIRPLRLESACCGTWAERWILEARHACCKLIFDCDTTYGTCGECVVTHRPR